MDKRKTITMWILAVAGISALNLSSACKHEPPTNISPETRSELVEAQGSENVEAVSASIDDDFPNSTTTSAGWPGEEEMDRVDVTANDPVGVDNVVAAEDLGVSIQNADGLEELTWKQLTDVEFKDVYVEELDAYYWKPTFGENVKALAGREVYITGYIIPVDYDENFYVLSRYPFANCFFCGGAGPESVVDLRFKDENRMYETDERLTFRGKLALNADDVYQMNYILEGAEEYE
ncbi:MAG: hypothetical protein ACPF83_05260 [Flavobacteriales bacterium]